MTKDRFLTHPIKFFRSSSVKAVCKLSHREKSDARMLDIGARLNLDGRDRECDRDANGLSNLLVQLISDQISVV